MPVLLLSQGMSSNLEERLQERKRRIEALRRKRVASHKPENETHRDSQENDASFSEEKIQESQVTASRESESTSREKPNALAPLLHISENETVEALGTTIQLSVFEAINARAIGATSVPDLTPLAHLEESNETLPFKKDIEPYLNIADEKTIASLNRIIQLRNQQSI